MKRKKNLSRELVDAALALAQARPSKTFGADQPLVFEVPTESHPLVCFVASEAGGPELGLLLWRGEDAIRNVQEALRFRFLEHHAQRADVMGVSLNAPGSDPGCTRAVLDAARFVDSGEGPVPCFFVRRPPPRRERAPTMAERKTLLYAIHGVLDALRRPEAASSGKAGGPWATLLLSGDPTSPEIRFEMRAYEDEGAGDPWLPAPSTKIAKLPRLRSTWVVGWRPLPPVEAVPELDAIFVVEKGSARLLSIEPRIDWDPSDVLQTLFGIFSGNNALGQKGRPRELIIVHREIYEVISPTLESIGITCRWADAHPLLDGLADGLAQRLGHQLRDGEEQEPPDGPEPLELMTQDLPDGDDLEGWRIADARVTCSLLLSVRDELLTDERVLATYFGSAEIGASMLAADSQEEILPPFVDWLAHHYRPARRRLSLVEELLREPLPLLPRERLAAHAGTVPSIYRVTGAVPGEHVDMVDVLSGKKRRVADPLLGTISDLGLGLPARLVPAGRFWLLVFVGPPLAPGEIQPALAYLEEHGLELTPDGIREQPHLLGRLWSWRAERSQGLRRGGPLQNEDGEALLWYRASFDLRDPTRARAAISLRKDIVADPIRDEYTWCRWATRERNLMEGATVLGHLQIIGSELVLDVNSKRRFEAARRWLTRIQGVELASVEEVSLEDLQERDVPLDDLLPEPPLSEPRMDAPSELQQLFRKQCLSWLDQELPALDGKTPRQAVRTERGQSVVRRLILTWADPAGNIPGLRVPRDELLRELGLELEDEEEAE